MANFRQALIYGNRIYVIWLLAIYAGMLLGIAGFNAIMDPNMIFRVDPMPDRIISTSIGPYFEKAASDKNLDVFLIGTSKTARGINTLSHKRLFNGGKDNATMGRSLDLLNHLLARRTRQARYFIEATSEITDEQENNFNMLQYLLGADRTMGNIRQALDSKLPGGAMTGKDFYNPTFAYIGAIKPTEYELKYRGEIASISKEYQGAVESMLKNTASRLAETRSTIVFYIPPHHPESLKHEKVIQSIAELAETWKEIFHNLKLESNPDIRFINLSGADGFWSAYGDEGPQSYRHWYDLTHFDTDVGELVLKELFSNTPGAQRPFIADAGTRQ